MLGLSISLEFSGCRGFWFLQNDGWLVRLGIFVIVGVNSVVLGRRGFFLRCFYKKIFGCEGLREVQKEFCKFCFFQIVGCSRLDFVVIRFVSRLKVMLGSSLGWGVRVLNGKNVRGFWDIFLSISFRSFLGVVWVVWCRLFFRSQRLI